MQNVSLDNYLCDCNSNLTTEKIRKIILYVCNVVTGKSLDSPEKGNVDQMSEKCRKNVQKMSQTCPEGLQT